MAARNIAVDGLQLRNDTAANWRSKNPILLAGEAGIETDTKKIKVGDGETTWNSLAYANAVDLSGYLTIEDAEAGFTPISHSTKSGYSIGEIGAASTYGHVKLSDAYTSTLSTSSGCAATPKAVNSVYKIANAKQSPATSLAGYGITDAYTRTEVDDLINAGTYILPTASSNVLGGVYLYESMGGNADGTMTQGAITSMHESLSNDILGVFNTLDTAIEKKANKATTLAGYGVSDAYTKEQVNEKIADAVTGGSVDLSGYLTRDEASTTYYTQTQVNEMMANAITEISVSNNKLMWTKGDGTTGSFDFSNIKWG